MSSGATPLSVDFVMTNYRNYAGIATISYPYGTEVITRWKTYNHSVRTATVKKQY